ncbi:MAG TPA: cytochrome d ubiquinol oxidase subunit II [Bacteroidales bacterium]|nr:cytochrome d ubiquinol oxidase subunit II [Bacteroidales bacterium]
MFENLSYSQLQQYWWIIISCIVAILSFLLFVQGGQTLLNSLSNNETEKTIIVNSLGRKWEFTFTTLVTFAGSMFAAFPKFYATSFGGAYWLWIAILFCFVIQAVSYEYRKKPSNLLGSKVYETFLFINGSIGVFLLGIMIATFYTGSQFKLTGNFKQVEWLNPFHGLEAILNIHNVTLGLALVFLARILGAQYIINTVSNENIEKKAAYQVKINSVLFLLFFISFIILLFSRPGVSIDNNGNAFLEKTKYLKNMINSFYIIIFFLLGVVNILLGIWMTLFTKLNKKSIWFSGIGTILTVFSLFIMAGFNNTAFYPSTADIQSSLTLQNSSASKYTLIVMSYVSLLLPLVFWYIYYTWKAINKKPLSISEIEQEEHKY